MKRMHHVNGTKERPRGRQCLTFRIAHGGPVIVDGIDPQYRGEMFSRLWAHYGHGNVWVSYRRMGRTEQYAPMDLPIDTEQAVA